MSEYNKLKSISVDAIEGAIAKALSELTGVQYDCWILNIKYDALERANFEVAVSMHNDMLTNSKSN